MVALSALTSHLQGLVPLLVRNQQKVVSFWINQGYDFFDREK